MTSVRYHIVRYQTHSYTHDWKIPLSLHKWPWGDTGLLILNMRCPFGNLSCQFSYEFWMSVLIEIWYFIKCSTTPTAAENNDYGLGRIETLAIPIFDWFWALRLMGIWGDLRLMLRSPSFYQGAKCQVWSSRFGDTVETKAKLKTPI